MMDRHSGMSFASPETANSTSTVSSPNSRLSHMSSKIHMSDMKVGPAAVAAAIASTSPSAQLLKMSEVPILRQNKKRSSSPEEMVEQDPLATRMWRLYRSSTTFLPDSVRLENMTWRMMAMTLRRKETKRNCPNNNSMQVDSPTVAHQSPPQRPSSAVPFRFAQPPVETAVGIASTVPYVPASSQTAKKEFGYIQKRLRKTSMDVAAMVWLTISLTYFRDGNVQLNFRLVFHL
jgi:hypothetical protein